MKSLYIVLFLCLVQYSFCQYETPLSEDYPELNRHYVNQMNKESRKNRDICTLPLETGGCRALFFKYGYDSNQKRCVEFMYGGCEGNENNFDTLEDCQKACPKPAEDSSH